MTNKSIDPLFISALDILTGALGVFIILNFLNTRVAGTTPPAPKSAQIKQEKPKQPAANIPRQREYSSNGLRGTQKYKPVPAPKPEPPPTPVQPKPAPAPPKPVEQVPPSPPADPVAVDLMKQTKGDVTLLLQQEGLAKQTVEFMLRQGSQSWKPSRASKYQNEVFQYEKSLNYFYQVGITPGMYEVWARVKRRTRSTGGQPFALYGKIIQAGMKTQTHNFGAYAVGSSDDWVRAGTFTVTASSVSFKSALPPATATRPTDEPVKPAAPSSKTEPKKTGKWGR
ncbi:MAG: hypothetical protein IPM81_21685 [Saprospirales bacterium]|nr:hypothetical protein [Saprospirales bacterium]